MDGLPFTFNGYGEYVLLQSKAEAPLYIMIHGRTELAEKEGEPVKATYLKYVKTSVDRTTVTPFV